MENEEFIYDNHNDMICSAIIAGRPLVDLIREIQHIYRSDERPWVVGFSGGKDSTVILSLTYAALLSLPPEEIKKPVYVVSSDTLVETPVVVDMIKDALASINLAAINAGLPVSAHPVFPKKDNTFWVNL